MRDVSRATPPNVGGLSTADRRLRRLQYEDAERLAELLAVRLKERLGQRELCGMSFQAIPRGGLFVLGYLSYFLSLTPQQLLPRAGAPLVLVDDCSISGARFWRYRQEHSGPLFFAHLYSHPTLRARIEQEPEVMGCVAAADLRDLAPERFPNCSDYEVWQRRCAELLGEERYWIGIPERIAFPWTEPDTILWHPVTGQAEPGWRLVSPDRCLGNRRLLNLPLRQDVVRQVRVPDEVAYQLTDQGVNLCDLRSERCFGLQGTAASMWRALAAYGEAEAAATYIAGQYAVLPMDALADTQQFLERLLALQLLEPTRAAVEEHLSPEGAALSHSA